MTSARLAALIALGLAAGPALTASLISVSQRNRTFELAELQVASGSAVRFNNDDDFPHQVAVRGPSLQYESDLIEPHQFIEIKFPSPGSFEVRCGVHPRMRMTIQVR